MNRRNCNGTSSGAVLMKRMCSSLSRSAMVFPLVLPAHRHGALPLVPAMRAVITSAIASPRVLIDTSTSTNIGDTLAARLATITTDTGDFAPGHRDFSRYDTPGLCRAAARVTRASFRLTLEAQAAAGTMSEDTVGIGGSAPVAHTCGAHFTLATVTARELGDFFDLALREQNDTLAQAILTKLLAKDTTPEARADRYLFGMHSYLSFGRLTAAKALLAQIDAQDSSVRVAQLAAYDTMLHFYRESGDTIHVRELAEREIAQGMKWMASEHSYINVLNGYRALVELAVLPHATTSLPALAVQAQRDLRQFPLTDQFTRIKRDLGDWGTFSMDTLISRLTPLFYSYHNYGGGVQASRLQADYWFPAPGHAASDTLFPVPGKVNLICMGGVPTDYWLQMNKHFSKWSGFQEAAQLKRWLARYGPDGLAIVDVRLIDGFRYFDFDVGGLSNYRVFRTPIEEAEAWHWYDQVYHQLPVTLAVQVKRTTQWLPSPDGRRLTVSSTQYQQYVDATTPQYDRGAREPASDGSCTIIGRDGKILYSKSDGTGEAENIGEILKWLMGAGTAQGQSR